MISKPRMGRITQGTIFCGGYAEDYSGLPVWGLVITARCDTTHQKTPIVNYLPVVTMEDWLHCHGGILSIDREATEVRNRFVNLLSGRQLSASLLEVHSPDEIAKLHFSVPSELGNHKAIKEAKEAELVKEIASLLSQLQQCLMPALPDRQTIQTAVSGCRKSVENVVKDLITHKLAGYYFLPTLGELTERPSKKGYVVLLREVHHMPRQGVAQLVEGISRDAATEAPTRGLCFDCFDFVYPVAELISPWTEHLMQSFCSLFGRIGVADIDKKVLTKILGDMTFKT
jgi:hypothetical protein